MCSNRNVASCVNMHGKYIFACYAVFLFLSRIILKRLNYEQLHIFRKLERSLQICVKSAADIKFMNFCLENQLLPKFTNFKLYDVYAVESRECTGLRRKILLRALETKKNNLENEGKRSIEFLLELKRCSKQRIFYPCVLMLKRIICKLESDVTHTHVKKLRSLYGGYVYLPKHADNVINISNYELTDTELSLLKKGLNFSIKKKVKPLEQKIAMERLFYDIVEQSAKNKVVLNEDEHLKIKLKNFSLRNPNDKSQNNLSQEEHAACRSLRSNSNIVIQRPDKGGGVVVMSKSSYQSKLAMIISDANKFQPCDTKQSENIKKKINVISNKYKDNLPQIHKKLRVTGEYSPGHLYGLPKIHKSCTDPPLRPIISMSGTVTHSIASYLNNIIRPYIESKYILRSTDEFLACFGNTKLLNGQVLCSLDVESLFTNVPVAATIDIIIKRAYNHPNLPPPPLAPEDLRELLSITTQETPFMFNNHNYVQVDGVSMGSPLGPTMADFYMSNLENVLLNENKISNPIKYLRYVDDIICVFKSRSHIHHFSGRLTRSSVLKFTNELMTGDVFNFLDVSLKLRPDGGFDTSVFIKPTDKGLYCNYSSHVPTQYKNSVISSLVTRAIKVSSTPENRNSELNRITQVLVNNGYPQHIIDKIIKAKLNAEPSISSAAEEVENINFYVELHNVSNFAHDTKRLKSMIQQHVKPVDEQNKVRLTTFYRPLKLSSMFSTRSRPNDAEKTCLVYQFSCPKPSCHEVSYIGYTNQMLRTRVKQHRWKTSSIYKHFTETHMEEPPLVEDLLKSFSIVHSTEDLLSIKIAEAILIKNLKPQINVKYNELFDFLKLF